MKKSKFLLLGSVASLAAIPFVAAKCGDTKEEDKKPAEKPGEGQKDPKTPAEGSMPADKDKDKKDKEDKTGGSTSTDNKDPKSPGESESAPMASNKIDLKKLEESVKKELNKLAKKNVLSEDVLDVLKKAKGLESIRLGDLSKVEFSEKDKKLTIEAHKDSKLVTGKYEFTLVK
nr:variable surface lipoprotein [Mycoplasmopsis agalactiae]